MTDIPLNSPPPPYPVPVAQLPLGPGPSRVTCSSCGANVESLVAIQPSMHTHMMALLLCWVCICCAFIPYFVGSCQNADHYCPNCDAYLGTYKN